MQRYAGPLLVRSLRPMCRCMVFGIREQTLGARGGRVNVYGDCTQRRSKDGSGKGSEPATDVRGKWMYFMMENCRKGGFFSF